MIEQLSRIHVEEILKCYVLFRIRKIPTTTQGTAEAAVAQHGNQNEKREWKGDGNVGWTVLIVKIDERERE